MNVNSCSFPAPKYKRSTWLKVVLYEKHVRNERKEQPKWLLSKSTADITDQVSTNPAPTDSLGLRRNKYGARVCFVRVCPRLISRSGGRLCERERERERGVCDVM